ncbi:hypothetical protein SPBR_03201 [Sporothrix brasiliensis 5110]|uniref:Uncharacterized protein n=1 Tax=Sporothrix brasiliensis 5110 TaxID=1398154 RepID=A0A0C2IT14_9PEZI|nr:uncharacterized protein SPBR_03201 [Sporothrix brasiliensis 5110]KIH92176.1 hypothetical protein SPBR_03201 [Sporothrix brasiliensis 5110]
MRLIIPLAVAAGSLSTVAAIAVPLPLQPARDSFPPARLPTTAWSDRSGPLRAEYTEDARAPDTLPGRRIGRLGGYSRQDTAVANAVEPLVVHVVVVSTTTSTEFQTATTTGTITPTAKRPTPLSTKSPTTAAPFSSSRSSSLSCDLRYCDAGTSYCEYWGGYSSFDVSQGRPIPGETRSSIGVCSTRASPGPVDSTTSSSSSSTSSRAGGRSSSSSSSSSTAFSSKDPLDSITCTSAIKSTASERA